MMKIHRRFIAALIMCCAVPAAAGSIFSGKVEVENEMVSVRQTAVKVILEKVLLKATGLRSLAENEELPALVNRGESWVERFHFETLELEDGLTQKWLHAEFNRQAITAALTERQIAIWPRRAPVVLAWVGFDDGQRREILNDEEFPAVANVVKVASEHRGISVNFPILDINERLAVSVADVWGQFAGPIDDASERYAPDVQLWGRVQRNADNQWVANWTLRMSDQSPTWQSTGSDLERVLADSMGKMVDYLVPVYAKVRMAAEVDAYVVHFKGVDSYDRFKQLMSSIRSHQRTKLVTVNKMMMDDMALNISIEGDMTELLRLLDRVPLMARDETVLDSDKLVYQLQ